MAVARLTRPQRTVVAVAFAVVLYVVGAWVVTWGTYGPAGDVAWAGYNSLGRLPFVLYRGGLQPWAKLAVWLACVAIWVAASASVLGARKGWRTTRGPSRVVAVVGAGVGLYLIGSWISGWNSYCGWAGCPEPRRVAIYTRFAYPPLQWQPWQLLLIWIGLTCVWLTIALWSLRGRSIEEPSESQ